MNMVKSVKRQPFFNNMCKQQPIYDKENENGQTKHLF